MNLRALFKDSALYSVVNILNKGMSIVLLPIYTFFLSPEQFGLIDYMAAIGSIIAVTVSLEVSQAAVRFLPEIHKESGDTGPVISASIISLLVTFGLFLAPALLFSQDISVFLFDTIDHTNIIKLCAVLFLLHGFVSIFNSILVATLRSKKSVIFSLLNTIVNGLTAYLILVNTDLRVEALLLGQIAGSVVALICFYKAVLGGIRLSISKQHLLMVYYFSIPLIPSSIGVIVATFTDRLMIKEFLDLGSLGVYGIALRVASIMTLITIGFRTAITPLIYVSYKADDAKVKIVRMFYLYLMVATVIVIFLLFFQDYIVLYLSSQEYLRATEVIVILASTVFISSCYVFFPGLSLAKKTLRISVVNVFGMLVNVGLNIYLIPIYGIIGAANATLVSAVITFMGHFIMSQKYYYLPISRLQMSLIMGTILSSIFMLQGAL